MRIGIALGVLVAGCGRIGFDAGDDLEREAIGELDPAFGSDGLARTSDASLDVSAYSIVRRATGYLAVGVRGDLAGNSAIALMGYTFDGQPDLAFAPGGVRDVGPGDNDFGYGAVRIDANRILVNGDGAIGTPTLDDYTLGIVDDNGTPDPRFGSGGFVRLDVGGQMRDDTANRAAVVGSTIIACGIGGYNVGDSTFALARFDFAGAPVASWGTAGLVADELDTNSMDECFDVVALADRVIAVGRIDDDRVVVVAYREADGSRDTGFATAGAFELGGGGSRALGVTTVAGDIVVVGERNGRGFVLRLAADGTPVASFGTAGVVELADADALADVAVQANGKLVVAGTGSSGAVVARLLADGTLDPSFGAAGVLGFAPDTELQKLALDPDGKIVTVGTASGGGLSIGVIARLR